METRWHAHWDGNTFTYDRLYIHLRCTYCIRIAETTFLIWFHFYCINLDYYYYYYYSLIIDIKFIQANQVYLSAYECSYCWSQVLCDCALNRHFSFSCFCLLFGWLLFYSWFANRKLTINQCSSYSKHRIFLLCLLMIVHLWPRYRLNNLMRILPMISMAIMMKICLRWRQYFCIQIRYFKLAICNQNDSVDWAIVWSLCLFNTYYVKIMK